MSTVSQFFSIIYSTTVIFLSVLLLELAFFVHAATRTTTRTTTRRSTTATTDELLKTIAPAGQYETELGLDEPFDDCSICLTLFEEGDEVRTLNCKHTYHKGCVDTWLQQGSATCPLCRAVVLPEEVAGKHGDHRYQDYYEGDDQGLMVAYAMLYMGVY